MHWLDWLRADLSTPDRRIDRSELPFLVGGVAFIVIAAQWQDPGTRFELTLVVVAGTALAFWPLIQSVSAEFILLAVTAPVATVVGRGGALELAFFLVAVATLYATWHLGSTIRAALITMACSAAIIVAVTRIDEGIAWAPWIAAEAFTFAAGRTLFRQAALIAELNDARQALAEQAVLRERQRIARELHDVSGHTLAAMMLHITGARHVLQRDPAEAEQALLDAETVGRSGMDRIRATVAALRSDEPGAEPALPDTGDLEHIIGEYRRAGLRIDAGGGADLHSVSGPIAVALHRIVREALANVARHATTNAVTITTDLNPATRRIHLEVRDRGRSPAGGPTTDRFGLIGMQERARAVGGTLSAGPTDDGWAVTAELPIPIDPSGSHRSDESKTR